jgi:hypothetical protein
MTNSWRYIAIKPKRISATFVGFLVRATLPLVPDLIARLPSTPRRSNPYSERAVGWHSGRRSISVAFGPRWDAQLVEE